MARSQLRVYYGPQSDVCATVSEAKETKDSVSVPLGEILPLLADAVTVRELPEANAPPPPTDPPALGDALTAIV